MRPPTNCIYCNIVFVPYKSGKPQQVCSNTDCIQKRKNAWGRNNPKCKQDWVTRNPEKRAQSSKKYTQAHKGYYAQYTRLRSALGQQACPAWANQAELEAIYREAKRLQLEVDHAIPLKHELVCGLHVPENLQFLTRRENAKKSNKFQVV